MTKVNPLQLWKFWYVNRINIISTESGIDSFDSIFFLYHYPTLSTPSKISTTTTTAAQQSTPKLPEKLPKHPQNWFWIESENPFFPFYVVVLFRFCCACLTTSPRPIMTTTPSKMSTQKIEPHLNAPLIIPPCPVESSHLWKLTMIAWNVE